MIGAIVRHWQGNIRTRWSNFSSSYLDHSVFLIEGSNHSYQRALHSFEVFRTKRELILLH